MEFVSVLKNATPYASKLDYMRSLFKHNRNLLIPLDSAYVSKKKNFDFKKFHESVCELRSSYKGIDFKIWIDSGGYAFIKGNKFTPNNADSLINSYTAYLHNYQEDYDFIFSLDLAHCNKDLSFANDLKRVKALNSKSLSSALTCLENNKKCIDKFVYVMHFIKPSHYTVWREIYEELQLGRIIKNRAVGGMVGVRDSKKSIPSPFIGIAYRCLIDFINGQAFNVNRTFRFHLLGVYLKQDRFQILLFEELFKKIIPGFDIKISFDSISFHYQVLKKHLEMPVFGKFDDIDFEPIRFFEDVDVDVAIGGDPSNKRNKLLDIYDKSHIEIVRKVFENSEFRRRNKINIKILKEFDPKAFKSFDQEPGFISIYYPFNLYSNNCIDLIMQRAIVRTGIAEKIDKCRSEKEIEAIATDFIIEISHCNKSDSEIESNLSMINENILFGNYQLLWVIRQNIIETFKFQKWINEDRSNEKLLDLLIFDFVNNYYGHRA